VTAPRLTVAVITLNEAHHLRRCLESVAWADEVVVVDAESHDKTVQVAREFTDRVIVRPWAGFAAQKNFALEQSAGDWVLSLDADEEAAPELSREIRGLVGDARAHDGYAMRRQNVFLDRWIRHGGLYPDWQVRLFRRGRGRFVDRAVHESVAVTGRIGRLAGHLVHRSYEGVSDFVERANRYSSLAAEQAVRDGRRVRAGELALRPLGRFLSMYVLKRGFLDGRRGLILAGLYAYYVFMRSAKVWEVTRR
jgi:glycosyltransferase involved in cell wall biosynthesis